MNVPPTHKDVLEGSAIRTLAEPALAALASTGPRGAAASVVIRKVLKILERWQSPSKSDYEQALAKEIKILQKELKLDDEAMQMALGQARAALADHGLSARELAVLGFNAEDAATEIAKRSGYYAIQDSHGPARRVLVKAIELLPEDPRQHRRQDAAFREAVPELFKSQDEQLRQQAELLGWVVLLEMPGQPWRKRPTPAQLLDPAAGILPYHPRPNPDISPKRKAKLL